MTASHWRDMPAAMALFVRGSTLHVVWRVGEEQVDGHPVQQPVEVGLAAGIPAEQAMVTEEPEVTGLGDRLVGWPGHVVGVGQPVLRLGGCQRREHRRQPLGVDADLGEELTELRLVGRSHRREWIRGRQDEPLLVFREVDVEDGDGRLPVRQRLLHAQVAIDEVAGPAVDDDLGHIADRVEHLAEGLPLGLPVRSPVAGVGEQLVRRLLAGTDDPVGPGRGSGLGRARHVHVVA